MAKSVPLTSKVLLWNKWCLKDDRNWLTGWLRCNWKTAKKCRQQSVWLWPLLLKSGKIYASAARLQVEHTHTHLTALCLGLPGWAGTRKVKPIWILLKQETVSGSGISWAIRKSAPRTGQIAMPATHHCFLQAGWPSCCPTNSVKSLKGSKTALWNK